jgi:hypothetical protein
MRGTRLDRVSGTESPGLRPLWTIPLEPREVTLAEEQKGEKGITKSEVDEGILNWHKNISEELENSQNLRTSTYIRNRDIYAGLHQNARGRTGFAADLSSDWGTDRFRMPEVIVNHSFELTEQWVSKLSRFSTTVDILPVNTEEGDRNAARATQRFANYLSDVNDFRGLFLNFIRDSKVGGESYIFVDYDPDAGDLHPSQKEAKKLGMRVPLLDAQGDHITSEHGDPLWVDKEKRVGDLVYRLRSVPEVLLQPKKRHVDVEWAREVDLVELDNLKNKYPDMLPELEEVTLARDERSSSAMGAEESSNEVFVYTYWHKRTHALDAGRKIVLIENAVLENDVNPFSGAPLPYVRLTDIDITGELHGWSFLNNLISMQIALNKLYTLWYKNIALGSHLYWMVPASARLARDRVRNSSSVFTYHGNQAPRIETFRTVQSDLMTLIDKLEQRLLTVSRIQSTSRGELPPNVEAGVAIASLEAQEEQSASTDIKKVNAAVEKLFKLSIGIAGDKYDKSDGRTARILGKEGEFLLETLDVSKLSGPYDVKVKKATALSQSKPLLVQQITQLEAMRPGFISNEQLYDLLDLGDQGKFFDIATAALRSADFENERMKEGKDIPEPTPDEFLLVHWRAHMTVKQTPSYKIDTKDSIKEKFDDHVIATEMLLVEKAKRNVALLQELMGEKYFPSLYQPDIPLPEILLALQNGDSVPLLGEADEAEPGELGLLPTDGGAPDDIPPEALPPGAGPEPVPGEGQLPTDAETAINGVPPELL